MAEEGLLPVDRGISTISQDRKRGMKYSRPEILDALRKIAPISLYSASHKIGLKYNTLSQAVREFEFAGLLKTRIEIHDNRAVKIVYFDEVKDDAV